MNDEYQTWYKHILVNIS